MLQGVPPTPHDGVDGVRDQLGPDVGLAEAVRDGLAEDERRHARRHRDAHRDEQDAYIIADAAEAFLTHYGVHIAQNLLGDFIFQIGTKRSMNHQLTPNNVAITDLCRTNKMRV